MVGRTGFTAEVGVVIAVHCRHRATETCSVTERTWPASRCRRLVSALCTRVAALLALMIHWTVEVGVRWTPWRSVTVLTAYKHDKHLLRPLSAIIWELKQRDDMYPLIPSLSLLSLPSIFLIECTVPKLGLQEAARGVFLVCDCTHCRSWRRVNMFLRL